MARKNMSLAERFWAQVGPPNEHGCRMWQGACSKLNGYGRFKVADGHQVSAHSYAWRLTNHGPIKPGTVFMHLCDAHYPIGSREYRPCCEPSHIRPGTHAENMRDAADKGRSAHGDRAATTKIPDACLPRVRELLRLGYRQVDIAKAYGVQHAAISKIKLGLSRRP